MEPASIRYKNPGAMWGKLGKRTSAADVVATDNPIAVKWGSRETVYLHDGLGQGNNIAVFPTFVDGICAQLDLWRTSKNYRNRPFQDAIAIWAGRNNVESYIAYVLPRVQGMTRDTIMDDAFWRSPMGIQFLKAQAGHEAGKTYPASESDWVEAQRRMFSGVKLKRKAGGVVVGTGAAVAASYLTEVEMMFAFTLGIVAGGFVVWKWKEQVQLFWKTGSEIAASLEAKAAAMRGKL